MLQKEFSHGFWCTRDMKFFCLQQCLLLKERKMLYSSVTIGSFFFPTDIIFVTNFCELVHRKTFVLPTDCCFWKKDLKVQAERRRSHWRQKRVVFQKTFWTSPRKTGNFEGIVFFFCLVNEISRKSFPNNYRSVKQSLSSQRNIKDRQRICFLFVDWANWKFFFFVEEMFRVSIV